jgi:hypothetical protein
MSMNNLGKAYCDAKQGKKAAATLRELITRSRKQFPRDHPRFAGLLARVALDLLQCEQFATAEEMLWECLAIREMSQPEAWTTFNTMSMLGGALLGRALGTSDSVERAALLAEAETLLVKGYEGMKAREQSIPPQGKTRIPEALERLIGLYTALDKADEVKKYRELRAKIPAAKKQ